MLNPSSPLAPPTLRDDGGAEDGDAGMDGGGNPSQREYSMPSTRLPPPRVSPPRGAQQLLVPITQPPAQYSSPMIGPASPATTAANAGSRNFVVKGPPSPIGPSASRPVSNPPPSVTSLLEAQAWISARVAAPGATEAGAPMPASVASLLEAQAWMAQAQDRAQAELQQAQVQGLLAARTAASPTADTGAPVDDSPQQRVRSPGAGTSSDPMSSAMDISDPQQQQQQPPPQQRPFPPHIPVTPPHDDLLMPPPPAAEEQQSLLGGARQVQLQPPPQSQQRPGGPERPLHAEMDVETVGVPRSNSAPGPSTQGRRNPPARRTAAELGGVERVDAFGRTRVYFSMEEVGRHSSPDDCWLAAHGKVYDVTAFLTKHPAGEFAILRHGGTDSTTDFDFHSSKAQRMWAPYLLGYVMPSGSSTGTDCVIS